MSIPFEEYLNAGLGTEAVITTASGALPVRGKFSSKYKVARILDIDIDSASPQLRCLSKDITMVKRGNLVNIQGKGTFVVDEIQAINDSVTNLILAHE